jgi:cephalosporin hydroxylase
MTGAEAYAKRGESDLGEYREWLWSFAEGNVFEIGVRDGHSTAAILTGLAGRGRLWSVDKEPCGHLYMDHNWTFIQGNSQTEPERILDATGMRSNDQWIDLLFIDGDHTFQGCLADLTNYGKYAKTIAVHDTNSEYMGVWHAVTEYFRSPWAGPFRAAHFMTASNGLGVLYR